MHPWAALHSADALASATSCAEQPAACAACAVPAMALSSQWLGGTLWTQMTDPVPTSEADSSALVAGAS